MALAIRFCDPLAIDGLAIRFSINFSVRPTKNPWISDSLFYQIDLRKSIDGLAIRFSINFSVRPTKNPWISDSLFY